MSELQPEPRGHTRTNGGSREKRLIDAILVAAILALTGTVYTQGQSIAVLRAMQDALQRQFDKDVARLDKRQDTLEGHITRGEVPGDAPDKQ